MNCYQSINQTYRKLFLYLLTSRWLIFLTWELR